MMHDSIATTGARLLADTVTLAEEQRARVLRVALAVVLVVGAFIRIYHFVANRTLWFDEALLAWNLVTRSAAELMTPLEHDQGAPLGFLLLERAAVVLFGPTERAMRLVPLLAGLGALALFPALARRYLGVEPSAWGKRAERWFPGVTVVLATAFFAIANKPVYYAAEVKQYSVDLLATIALLVAGHPLLTGQWRTRELALYAFLGFFFVSVSHSAALVIAAVTLTGMGVAARRRQWRQMLAIGLCAAPAALLFAALYLYSMRQLASNTVLVEYWEQGFMPFPPWRDWGWFPTAFSAFLQNPVETAGPFAMLLLAAGVIGLGWRQPAHTVALLLTFGVTLIASAAHAYPVTGRLVLFLTPLVYLLIAEGLGALAALVPMPKVRAALWAAGAVVIIVQLIPITAQRVASPYTWREYIRPVMQHLETAMRPGDTVYCYRGVCKLFEYYALVTPLPEFTLIKGQYIAGRPETDIREMDVLSGHDRVWLLIGRPWPGDDVRVTEYMDGRGVRLDEVFGHDIGAILYDTRPDEAPGPSDVQQTMP